MPFEVKVIEKSKADVSGVELTTFQLKYPRFIHSEFMTHRVFSRNASSSRAIPVEKMLEQVRKDPAMPIHWGQNQPGMQAKVELPMEAMLQAKEAWKTAAEMASYYAAQMHKAGAHKQIVNRILEPFQWISVIVTATEWDNFYALRDHADAQPEIAHLAGMMKYATSLVEPKLVRMGEWHLPYVGEDERALYREDILVKLSAARCARVSYLTHDGQAPDVFKDIALYDRLVGSTPIHASPVEHQATPNGGYGFNRNFKGWSQHRNEVEQRILNAR